MPTVMEHIPNQVDVNAANKIATLGYLGGEALRRERNPGITPGGFRAANKLSDESVERAIEAARRARDEIARVLGEDWDKIDPESISDPSGRHEPDPSNVYTTEEAAELLEMLERLPHLADDENIQRGTTGEDSQSPDDGLPDWRLP